MVLATTPKRLATALDCIPPCNKPMAVERCSDVSLERRPIMDSSTTVNQDKLKQYMVNFNPMADRFMIK